MGKYRTGRYPMQVILEHLGDLYYPCTTPAQNAEEGLASIVGCMMNPSYLGYWSTQERGYLNLRHKIKCIRPDGHSVNRERALARRSSQVYDISFPWVIIPYRPQWLKARIAYLLNLVASRWFRDPAPILCGWRLSESHLHIRLRSLNEKYQSLPHFEFFHPPDDR